MNVRKRSEPSLGRSCNDVRTPPPAPPSSSGRLLCLILASLVNKPPPPLLPPPLHHHLLLLTCNRASCSFDSCYNISFIGLQLYQLRSRKIIHLGTRAANEYLARGHCDPGLLCSMVPLTIPPGFKFTRSSPEPGLLPRSCRIVSPPGLVELIPKVSTHLRL